MSYVLTETDSYDLSITVPEGTDPVVVSVLAAAFQKLADRTKYLQARGGLVAMWQLAASSLADGSKIPLTVIRSDGFTLSDSLRRIQAPEQGWYRAELNGYSQGTVLDSLDFYVAGVIASNHAIYGMDTPTGGDRAFNGFGLLFVNDPETDLIDIRGNTHGGGSFSLDATYQNALILQKVHGI